MSVSYGTITITDTTDLGQLSVYLTGSTVRQQIYDAGSNPPTTSTYYPDWTVLNGTPLIITPHVYYNGTNYPTSSSQWTISWSKVENGTTYNTLPVSPATTNAPESFATDNKSLQRPANLSINSAGATYTATINFYPIVGDNQTVITGVATLDLTIANNGAKGEDGQPGTPAKTLQLIGSGSHFTYDWQNNPRGIEYIDLTVEKSSTIGGVHWYCDDTLIRAGNNNPYTALSLRITTTNIGTYSSNYDSNKLAQFRIVETDASGNEMGAGTALVDYFTIYKLQDAAPGTSTYSAYLDNDQETVNEYNGAIDFTNATTIFHLDKGGQNNLVANSGWTITISDSGNLTYTTGKSSFNTLPTGNNNEVTAITAMTGNVGWIQFTAQNTDTSISSQIKRFTIQKNSSLVSHALRLNSVVANRDASIVPNGVYTPAQIVVDAIIRTGGGTEPYHVANTIEATIYYRDGSTSSPIYNGNSALTLTLADKNISGSDPSAIDYIDIALKYNNETVDSQKIVITYDGVNGEDGEDGTSPWSFILGNTFDGISTDFAYKATQAFTIRIPVEAFEGTTKKDIHRGGETYPTIAAGNLSYTSGTTTTTITPKYYNNDTEVITTTGATINNIRYEIAADALIGSNGTINLTLTYDANKTITQTYSYNAQPEALKPIRIQLDPVYTVNGQSYSSSTFDNQEGSITITPTVFSGTAPVTSGLSNQSWQALVAGQWVAATNTGATISGNRITITGNIVKGYLGLRYTVQVTAKGITETYIEYINLTDIDDPLQVTLHSTIGERIVNGQGMGVIYARVVRKGDEEDYDTVVPDNLLGVGTVAPSGSINTGNFEGKTGYCYIVLSGGNPTGEIRYYWRDSVNSDWVGYRGNITNPYKYNYTWNFRDSDNVPYNATDASTPTALKYALNTSHNTQFVYLDANVVKNKVTAVVRVEL